MDDETKARIDGLESTLTDMIAKDGEEFRNRLAALETGLTGMGRKLDAVGEMMAQRQEPGQHGNGADACPSFGPDVARVLMEARAVMDEYYGPFLAKYRRDFPDRFAVVDAATVVDARAPGNIG